MTKTDLHARRDTALDSMLAVHGSLDFEELQGFGLSLDDVLDFSSNINPYGPSPKVPQVLASMLLDRHPDRECFKLREALAQTLNVAAQQILPGNGSSELIWLIGLAFIQPGDKVLVFAPTFTEYARTARLCAANLHHLWAGEESSFMHKPEKIARSLRNEQPRLVFLCNPNNPTGSVLPLQQIASWVREFPHILFVIDEAFLAFAAGIESAMTLAAENVLVLRSMTKDYALAGLRLGYAVGPEPLITKLRAVQPPWSVNALAQSGGVAALDDVEHLRSSLAMLASAKKELVQELTQLGLAPWPSATHFFLCQGISPHSGKPCNFRVRLLEYGIVVRDCTSLGLPAYVRIAARRPEENARLVAAIKEVL